MSAKRKRDSSAQARVEERIRSHAEDRELVDLHAHLMGMGTPSFWVDEVMRKRLPDLIENNTGGVFTTECSYSDVFHPKLSAVMDEVTTDVVFPLDKLYEAFQTDEKNLESLATAMNDPSPRVQDVAQNYTIFNARDQKVEHCEGVTLDNILLMMHNDSTLTEILKTRFFINVSGNDAKSLFSRGRFTPVFYPSKFSLKDCLYRQYPIVLEWLIDHVVERYYQAGVYYVELSMGIGDLAKRPWLYRHLAESVYRAQARNGVIVRFLAGFGRHVMPAFPNNNSHDPALDSWDTCTDSQEAQLATDKLLKELNILKENLNLSWESKEPIGKMAGRLRLHEVCVGLDYFGDEHNHPMCPFSHDEFIRFLQEQRKKTGAAFGFRIHCGEIIAGSYNDGGVAEHMAIMSKCINKILSETEEDMYTSPVLRIGHGIAFQHWLGIPEPLDEVHREVYTAMNRMRERHIPIEVNLTSNDILVKQNRAMVSRFLQHGYSIVICTDDDGIWDCRYPMGTNPSETAVSVEAEYLIAALFSDPHCPAFEPLHIDKLVQNAEFAKFASGSNQRPVLFCLVAYKSQFHEYQLDKDVKHFFPIDPDIFHLEMTKEDFDNREKNWHKWIDDMKRASNLISSKVQTHSSLTVAAKCPLSLMTYLGYHLNLSLNIMNQPHRNGAWQFFDLMLSENSKSETLSSDLELIAPPEGCQEDEVVVLYMIHNRDYLLKEDDFRKLGAVLSEYGKFTGAVYQLISMKGEMKLEGKEDDHPTDFRSISASIRSAMKLILQRQTNKKYTALVCTGPQPLAYLLGYHYKQNVHGDVLLLDRVKGDYQIAFCSRHQREEE